MKTSSGIRNSKWFWGDRVGKRFFNRDIWANVELTAVILLAAGKFVVGDVMQQDVWFALAGGLLCIGYISTRIRRHPELIEAWGLSARNLGISMAIVLPVTALSVAGAFWYGVSAGTAVLHWHMSIVFLLYPVWGIVQQFLLVVLVAGNVDRVSRGKLPRILLVLPVALLFAIVHIPVPTLMAVTFGMGCFTTAVFLRYRTIWAIGIFHGLFATALYYFVLGQDPLRGFLGLAG